MCTGQSPQGPCPRVPCQDTDLTSVTCIALSVPGVAFSQRSLAKATPGNLQGGSLAAPTSCQWTWQVAGRLRSLTGTVVICKLRGRSKFVYVHATLDTATPESDLLLAPEIVSDFVPAFVNFFRGFFRRYRALHHQSEILVEHMKIGFIAGQHQRCSDILGIFQGGLDKLLPELGENCFVCQVRAAHGVPETLGMRNGLISFRRSGEPL